MYTQAEKPKENKSRAVASSVGQKNDTMTQNVGFVDNRAEAVAQRKLQEMANNNTISENVTLHPIIQRFPAQISGNFYKDNEYPKVRFEKLAEGGMIRSNTYQLLNGPKKNTVIRYTDLNYYQTDEEGWEDTDRRVAMANYVATTQELMAGVTSLNIGSPGTGITAGYESDVTLQTTGILTCVGWLIYNQSEAYMEHIVVGSGKINNIEDIRNATLNIINRFTLQTEDGEYNLAICCNTHYSTYKNYELMGALNPTNVAVNYEDGGSMTHVVKRSGRPRRIWECNKRQVNQG